MDCSLSQSHAAFDKRHMAFSHQEDVRHGEETRPRDCHLLGLLGTIIRKQKHEHEKSLQWNSNRKTETCQETQRALEFHIKVNLLRARQTHLAYLSSSASFDKC